jgi:HNH endonuclease
MRSSICILCLQTKVDFPPEHVFPEAIGGALEIDRVCSDCNHWLGSNVDAHLTDHWLVRLRRRELNLKGKKGALPRLRLIGDVDELPGVKVILEYDADDQLSLRTQPRVLIAPRSDGASDKQVILHDAELGELATVVNKIRERSGQEPLSADRIAASYPTQSLRQPKVTFTPEIDIHDYRRAVVKIVYELAHRWLGEEYLDDPVAGTLRDVIKNSGFSPEDFEKSDLRAQILIGTDLLPAFPIDARVSHLAYTQRVDSSIVVCVQLFEVFQACVVISNDSLRYAATPNAMAVLLDTKTGKVIESSLAEVLQAAYEARLKEERPACE